MAKAEWGWSMRSPPAHIIGKVQKAIHWSLSEPKQASVPLRDILRGHRLNLPFRITSAILRGLHRVSQSQPLPEWTHRGIAPNLNKLLTAMSWIRTQPWTWRHAHTGREFSLDRRHINYARDLRHLNHDLREGFRSHAFHTWKSSERNDATACPHAEYQEVRCRLAHKQESSNQHRFAIMCGAFVSPAAFGRQAGSSVQCACGAVATLDHVVWHCPLVPQAAQRPRVPADQMQRRLGWPCQNPEDEAVIAWFVHVRKHTLSVRYKPPVADAD